MPVSRLRNRSGSLSVKLLAAISLQPNGDVPSTRTIHGTLTGEITSLGASILQIFLMLGGALAVLYLVWSGLRYISAGGDLQRAKDSRAGVVNAIVGIIIILAVYTIIRLSAGLGRSLSTTPDSAAVTTVTESVPPATTDQGDGTLEVDFDDTDLYSDASADDEFASAPYRLAAGCSIASNASVTSQFSAVISNCKQADGSQRVTYKNGVISSEFPGKFYVKTPNTNKLYTVTYDSGKDVTNLRVELANDSTRFKVFHLSGGVTGRTISNCAYRNSVICRLKGYMTSLSGSTVASDISVTAYSYVNTPNSEFFDAGTKDIRYACSAFVSRVLMEKGIIRAGCTITDTSDLAKPRYLINVLANCSAAQFVVKNKIPISKSNLRKVKAGDIVFTYFGADKTEPSHVGIYAGYGDFIHTTPLGRVKYQQDLANHLTSSSHFTAVRITRVPGSPCSVD